MIAPRLLVACAVALLVADASLHVDQHGVAVKVPDKAPSQALPFRLNDVRLLDGPFQAAMRRDQDYLMSLAPDRLLHTFRINAGLPSPAEPLGGWEAPDVELRGHTMGHYLSALALMYATTGEERFKERADATVAELARIQTALARKFNPGYLSAFPEELFDRVEARQRVWAPYYTIHKIMAGLLDVHQLAGNAQALDVLEAKADWVQFRVGRLTEAQQQAALQTEFGGMNDLLANLYAVTGEPKYLDLARKFDHQVIFEPLARGEDPLARLHANTQIPKIIGAAREYELTGEERYRKIADVFWTRVVKHRSYVNGGHSDDEAFFPPEEFSRHLGTSSSETCNTYNMLKLTRHLFSWAPAADKMDYYERALFNHILPSQDPATGMVSYYCPFRPGAYKTYSTPTDSFWCCVGTGLENHAKYNDSIYFRAGDALLVNLFIASELTWREKGLSVRQVTRFPEEEATTLTVTAAPRDPVAIKVRYPAWAGRAAITINGRPEKVAAAPGSYISLERQWSAGDVIRVALPMTLRTEAMPDDPRMVAVMYGPLVLAADLGKEGLGGVPRYGPSTPQMTRVPPIEVPALVAPDPAQILSRIVPVPGSPLAFRTKGLGRPADVTLVPFSTIVASRYNVYWNVFTPAAWETHRTETAAAEARRKEVATRTVDTVDVNSDESEKGHDFQSRNAGEGRLDGRRWRDARDGWISYTLRIEPDKPVTLVAAYRGNEGRRREFDVYVNEERVANDSLEYHPGDVLHREYPVPAALTRGKTAITVKLVPRSDARTGGLLELRAVQ